MKDAPSHIIIIGAGAAGFFCAINLAGLLKAQKKKAKITILEKSPTGLRKVRISGGGRCNVTHHQLDKKEFLKNYPRGHRQLRGPLYEFSAEDTIAWFKERAVELKVEADGRMFPKTNSSQTIIDCFQKEAIRCGVEVIYKTKVESITKNMESQTFTLESNHGKLEADYLCLATGSDRSGHRLAQSLGHKISDLAPSLFTFKVTDPLLKDLAGTSFKQSEITILQSESKAKLQEKGPLLITHWGLSGPAILKISAWGARELKELNYHFRFRVNFLNENFDHTKESLRLFKARNLKKQMGTLNPFAQLTLKFWQQLLNTHGLDHKSQWANLSQKEMNRLAMSLTGKEFESVGSHRHKEEFVECGGIESNEINFKMMESKVVDNLYFAGELLDIDGITGGFNFQNAWSTAYAVSNSIGMKIGNS